MMKNIKTLGLLTIAGAMTLMGLSACSDDVLDNGPKGSQQSEKNRVEFRLATVNTPGTRAEVETPALGREKKITGQLLVAAFRTDGSFYHAYTADPVDGIDDTYEFDMETSGRFNIYVLANGDDKVGTAVKNLPTGASVADFGKIVYDQNPGEDATAGGFLMLSSGTTVTAGTPVDEPILLKRAAVRFDFYNRVPNLTISKIIYKRRAVTTALETGGFSTSTVTLQDKEYTANGTTITFGDGGKSLTAVIYSYENPQADADAASFVFEGTYGGQTITSPEFTLATMTDGEGNLLFPKGVERNHLYSLVLNPNDEEVPNGTQWGDFTLSAVVDDWSAAVKSVNFASKDELGIVNPVITKAEITTAGNPTRAYDIIDIQRDAAGNPTKIYIANAAAQTVDITVDASIAPTVSWESDATSKGATVAVKEEPFTREGTLSTYTVSIPATNDWMFDHSLIIKNGYTGVEKKVRFVKRPRMGIDNISRYVLAKGSTPEKATFNKSEDVFVAENYAFYNWSSTYNNPSTITEGIYAETFVDKSLSIGDSIWHMPTAAEGLSVYTPTGIVKWATYDEKTTNNESITVGSNTATYSGSYIGTAATDSYAVRFIGNGDGLKSAWHYQKVAGKDEDGNTVYYTYVTMHYIGKDNNAVTSASQVANDNWVESDNDITIELPLAGYITTNGSLAGKGLEMSYWCTAANMMHVNGNDYQVKPIPGNFGFCIRPFITLPTE